MPYFTIEIEGFKNRAGSDADWQREAEEILKEALSKLRRTNITKANFKVSFNEQDFPPAK